jgi:hypothetical protein
MSEPMIVVAISQGYYGEKIRYEGERFALKEAAHFSARWMVDPNGSDFTSAHRALEQSYKLANETASTRKGISDEQLLAEVTQSSGVIAGLRAENLQLKEKVSALQGQLDRALAGSQGSVRAEPTRAKRAEPVASDVGKPDETGDDGDAAEAAGNVGSREAETPRRVRRNA